MTEEDIQTRKRVCSTNYTTEEKAILINIITKHKNIIESKKTDKVSWKDKSDTWEIIKNEFNSIAPSGTYRTTDSLKKFYENMKKERKKNIAQEKMELYKTGGGRPTHKILNPLHESILTLMNTKTVEGNYYYKFSIFFIIYLINFIFEYKYYFIGLDNRFDCDATNTFNSFSNTNNAFNSVTDSTTSNNVIDSMINNSVSDSMINNATYIYDSNESNVDTEECTMYEVLDDDLEETGITHDVHVVSISMNKINIYFL